MVNLTSNPIIIFELGILLLAAIAIIFTLYFRVKELKSKLKKLSKKSAVSNDSADNLSGGVRSYLDSQKKQTALTLNKSASIMTPELAALRGAYLQAESEALNETVGSDSYWKSLQDRLSKIVKVFYRGGNRTDDETKLWEQKVGLLKQRIDKLKGFESESAELKIMLDKAEAKLLELESSNSKNSEENINKVTQFVETLECELLSQSTDFFPESDGEIDSLEKIIARQSSIIDFLKSKQCDEFETDISEPVGPLRTIKLVEDNTAQLNNEIFTLRDQLENTRREVNRLKFDSDNNDVFSTNAVDNGKTPTPDNTDFEQLEETRDRANFYKNEINNMRISMGKQAELIAVLKNEMANVGEQEVPGDDDRITSLNQLIKESENCIVSLESEVELLFSQLKELEQSSSTGAGTEIDTDSVSLDTVDDNDEPVDVSGTDGFDEELIELMYACIECSTLEDLSLAILESLNILHTPGTIVITTDNKQISASQTGTVDKSTSDFLTKIKVGQGSIINVNEGMVIAHPCLRVFINNNEISSDSEIDRINPFLKFMSYMAEKIDSQQTAKDRLTNFEYLSRSTLKLLNAISTQMLTHEDETLSIIEMASETTRKIVSMNDIPRRSKIQLMKVEQEVNLRAKTLHEKQNIMKKFLDKSKSRLIENSK